MQIGSFAGIDAMRGRLGVSQKAMCELADVSESTLSRHRTAGTEPTKRIIGKLERALHHIARQRGVQLLENSKSEAAQ